jgi:hypothetical protein
MIKRNSKPLANFRKTLKKAACVVLLRGTFGSI